MYYLKITRFFILILSAFFLFGSSQAAEIKMPAVKGSFYPSDSKELALMIDDFLSFTNPQIPRGEIFALISPHAGYGYSGQVAAFGYKLIKDKPYKTVVILGTSHFYAFNGVSVYKEGKFRTPLGDLEIDSEFANKLLDKNGDIIFDTQAFEKEHSVEVQLPFLQKTLADFKIVPIVMGDCTLYLCQELARLLKQAIGTREDVLIVVSSDMYHGYDYEQAEKIDNLTLGALKKMSPDELYNGLRENKFQMCGGFGAVTALALSKELGLDKLNVLKYTNSAVVTGNLNKGTWIVGYTSCVIEKSGSSSVKEGEAGMLNASQRKRLLEIARNSIETYLKTGKKLELEEKDPVLLKEMGAFVTLREGEDLRGCIGNMIGKAPLYLTIRDMAIESATGDPRFNAVTLPELKSIDIEISVLSPMQKVDSAEKIELGKHGVLVKRGIRSGVFLPQVAQETGWTKEEFLSNLCSHKAGLEPDAWKNKNTELFVFTAEIFSEEK